MVQVKEKKKKNICGIIGLATGGLVPIVGFLFGLIALIRKEETWIALLALIVSVISCFIWYFL